jgi:DNA-binding protein H-NS
MSSSVKLVFFLNVFGNGAMETVQNLRNLMDQKAQVEAQIQEEKARLRDEGLAKLRETIEIFGLSREDLISLFPDGQKPGKRKKASGRCYYNPENPEQTYGGKGRSPEWFKAIPKDDRKNYIVQP